MMINGDMLEMYQNKCVDGWLNGVGAGTDDGIGCDVAGFC